MQHSPLKDTDFGIVVDHEQKFADVRHKALKEYIHRKAKRKKGEQIPVPITSPGKLVVVSCNEYGNPKYYLFEVVDFCLDRYNNNFNYIGILIKTSDPKSLDRIGRLDTFGSESRYSFFSQKKLTKFSQEDIKWLTTKESEKNNET